MDQLIYKSILDQFKKDLLELPNGPIHLQELEKYPDKVEIENHDGEYYLYWENGDWFTHKVTFVGDEIHIQWVV